MREKPSEDWLWLWHKCFSASLEEEWKWCPETWRPVTEKLMRGPIDDVACPICGQRGLQFYFILVYEGRLEGRKRYIADRWMGCDSCQVQYHDRAFLPDWIDPGSVEWAPALKPKDDAEA